MAASTEGKQQETRVIVDEVPGWLRVYADGSVERTWPGPPEAEFLSTPYNPFPETARLEDGVELHDITVPPPFDLSLRLYIPVPTDEEQKEEEEKERLPVLLHVQGGGFCVSHATWYMYYQFYSRLAVALGAAVVSVSTRLAPEHRLPAAIHDCYSALLWLRSLARSSDDATASVFHDRADFSRVFLIGDSSGGTLVHHALARAGTEEAEFWSPLRVAGGVMIHPGLTRSERSRSELEAKPNPFLSLESMDKFHELALPLGATCDHHFLCPMGEAAPPMEGLCLPPLMVAVAEDDLMRDRELEYCEAMRKAGKDVEVVVSKGMGHSFYLNKVAVDMDPSVGRATDELIEAVKAFVRRH